MGYKFIVRGMGKNLVAVSIPVASTIFFTDMFIQFRQDSHGDGIGGSSARIEYDTFSCFFRETVSCLCIIPPQDSHKIEHLKE
mmetsp:Transcript_14513/g.21343  ORF Transcript_14513/g.21343 Transcript_14513/m.21343 type:complete len:83 (+) Transcript_14513:1021-1269(+)